jgi:hypothetical protein
VNGGVSNSALGLDRRTELAARPPGCLCTSRWANPQLETISPAPMNGSKLP